MKQPIMFDDENELKIYIDEKIIEYDKELFINYIQKTIKSMVALTDKNSISILINPIFYNLFIKNTNYITPTLKFRSDQLVDEKIIKIDYDNKDIGITKELKVKFIITNNIKE